MHRADRPRAERVGLLVELEAVVPARVEAAVGPDVHRPRSVGRHALVADGEGPEALLLAENDEAPTLVPGESPAGRDVEAAVRRLVELVDAQARQPVLVAEFAETPAVVPEEAVVGPDPDVADPVLEDALDRQVLEPFFLGVGPELEAALEGRDTRRGRRGRDERARGEKGQTPGEGRESARSFSSRGVRHG